MQYKIGITSYDDDRMLYETHIGNVKMDLLYSCWGATEQESKEAASALISLLDYLYTSAVS